MALVGHATQRGVTDTLDSGDVRVLNAAFRSGSVWCSLTTAQNWGDGTNVCAVQWFEVKIDGSVAQQGIFGAQGFNYFYPAIMPNQNGDALLVFSRSGGAEYPSLYVSTRKAADTAGKLGASTLLQAGAGPYVHYEGTPPNPGRNRWGDYQAAALDPAGEITIWCYGGHADTPQDRWATTVAAVVP